MAAAEELFEVDPERERVKKRAMGLFNARAWSIGELVDKLVTKGEDEQASAQVAARFAELGLLDDVEYARSLARNFTRRGYGARRVRDEFYRRKIPKELWDEALNEVADARADDDGAPAAAVRFIEQKLRGEAPENYKEKQKVAAGLARRGFSWDEINAAFAAYLRVLESRDDGFDE